MLYSDLDADQQRIYDDLSPPVCCPIGRCTVLPIDPTADRARGHTRPRCRGPRRLTSRITFALWDVAARDAKGRVAVTVTGI